MEWSFSNWRLALLGACCAGTLALMGGSARFRLERSKAEPPPAAPETTASFRAGKLAWRPSPDVAGAVIVTGEIAHQGESRFRLARFVARVRDGQDNSLGQARVFLQDFAPAQTRSFRVLLACEPRQAARAEVTYEDGYTLAGWRR